MANVNDNVDPGCAGEIVYDALSLRCHELADKHGPAAVLAALLGLTGMWGIIMIRVQGLPAEEFRRGVDDLLVLVHDHAG